jgi:putative transcriptional regulator
VKQPRTRMRQLRLNNQLTQEELGRKIGVSKQTISGIELGVIGVSYDMAQRIAAVFRLKPDDIFFDSESIQTGESNIDIGQATGTEGQ